MSNGYEIVSSNHREVITGQEVYSVRIRTAAGEIRNGEVRCGRWIVGTLANATSVQMGRLACGFQLFALSSRPSRQFR